MPKLGQGLRAAIRTVLEVCQRHKRNHLLVLDSGSDCVSGENNQNVVLVSLLMLSFGSLTLPSPSTDELLVQCKR